MTSFPDSADVQPKTIVLVAIDGTWQQAREMYNRNTQLRKVCQPVKLAFPPCNPDTATPQGQFVLRKPPSRECVSTLEAVANAVSCLENDDLFLDVICRPMRRMVELQLLRTDPSNVVHRPEKKGYFPEMIENLRNSFQQSAIADNQEQTSSPLPDT